MLSVPSVPYSIGYKFPEAADFGAKGYPLDYINSLSFIRKQLDHFLEAHGVEPNSGESGSFEWNASEACFEFVLPLKTKFSDSAHSPSSQLKNFRLDGRSIRIKFKNSPLEGSDEELLKKRFAQLKKTTYFFLKNYRKTLDASQEKKFSLYVKMIDSILENEPSFRVPTGERSLDLTQKRERALAKSILQQKYSTITQIIMAMTEEGLIEAKNLRMWRRKAVDIEAKMTSEEQLRDVLVSVFPVASGDMTDPSPSDKNQWICEWCTPMTDIASPLRTGDLGQLPNAWQVKTIIFGVDQSVSGAPTESLQYRSASFPAIKEKNKETRRELTQIITENHLRFLYREQLLKYLQEQGINTSLSNLPPLKLCVTSLLSPVVVIAGKTPEKDKDTRQIRETETAYEYFRSNGFTITQEDVDYLKKFLPSGIDAEQEKLTGLVGQQVQAKILYQNFGTNSFRGLDVTGAEEKLTKRTRSDFAESILEKHKLLLAKVARKQNLEKTEIQIFLERIAQNETNDFSEKSNKMIEFVEQLKRLDKSDRASLDLYNDLCLYYRYFIYSQSPYPRKKFYKKSIA